MDLERINRLMNAPKMTAEQRERHERSYARAFKSLFLRWPTGYTPTPEEEGFDPLDFIPCQDGIREEL